MGAIFIFVVVVVAIGAHFYRWGKRNGGDDE